MISIHGKVGEFLGICYEAKNKIPIWAITTILGMLLRWVIWIMITG